jgi:NADH-quinone oxidoreductase subunit L
MPVTFWTFLIGGMALAGLPFITAGFWSKDEILLDALLHAPVVFWTLSAAALLTAFYTTRQLWMVFFGAPRSPAAEHAHESSPAMTVPLVVLSVFAVFAGYLNVPEDFPVFGPIVNAIGLGTGWFHEFVGGTLVEHPEALPTLAEQPWALVMSMTVALGGILLGWLVYRNAWKASTDVDPVERALGSVIYGWLKNKYWIDELYDVLFVRPAFWLARVFFTGVDRNVIDNVLHGVAWISLQVGNVFRDYFDRPVVNGASDGTGVAAKWAGRELRITQIGRVQAYLIMVMIGAAVIGVFMWTAR